MKYRLTCLTPTLVGDGSHLSPIDYMVWKDQVNVLAQHRIFRLLSKGPRLDSYLKQIKQADKLDFASWGGFAQNFADRRIAFEHTSCARYWAALPSEFLRIPTFVSSPSGPFLPGSTLRGAIHTALVAAHTTPATVKEVAAQLASDRPARHPGRLLEERVTGPSGKSRLKGFRVSDSTAIDRSAIKIFMVRVSTLTRREPDRFELRWKSSRGSVEAGRPEASTPTFVEMAAPGTVFCGSWKENPYYQRPEVVKALRWKRALSTKDLFQAANRNAAVLLAAHRRYAAAAGLFRLADNIKNLEARLAGLRENGDACLVSIGWGGGFLNKTGIGDPAEEACKQLLRESHLHGQAIRTGLPFPKTRRIVFLEDRPAALPGWATLELE